MHFEPARSAKTNFLYWNVWAISCYSGIFHLSFSAFGVQVPASAVFYCPMNWQFSQVRIRISGHRWDKPDSILANYSIYVLGKGQQIWTSR